MRNPFDAKDACFIDESELYGAGDCLFADEVGDGCFGQCVLECFDVYNVSTVEAFRGVDLEFTLSEDLAEEVFVAGADKDVVSLSVDFHADHGTVFLANFCLAI